MEVAEIFEFENGALVELLNLLDPKSNGTVKGSNSKRARHQTWGKRKTETKRK